MKKWAIGFGILLLFSTLIFLSVSNQPAVKTYRQLAGTPVQDWECRGNFLEGDIVGVKIMQNLNWSQGPYALDPSAGDKLIYVEVVDPNNGSSRYELEYTINPSYPTHGLQGINFTVLAVGDGLVPPEKNAPKFGEITFVAGTAKYNGTYVARIALIDPPVQDYDKPSYFALFRGYHKTVQPYSSFLYVGLTTLPVGSILLIYGFSSKKRKEKRIPHNN
jgi:hypothetical protein